MAGKAKEKVTVTSFNKRETWVGLTVVTLVLLVGGVVLGNSLKGTQNQKNVSSTFIEPTPSVVAQKPEEKPKVTMLANTTGDTTVYIAALKNDSFWKITKRVCGTGRNYLANQAYNGYGKRVALQQGDVVAVFCY